MKTGKVVEQAITYFGNDVRRISHFLKVYGYAKTIGELEGLTAREQEILEVTAVLHDIGIKIAEEKYHSSAGNYQEIEGPAVARVILEKLGYDEELIKRVTFLIGHHHTYDDIQGKDYQILVEADFLVNMNEDDMNRKQIETVRNKIFRTESGIRLLDMIFLNEEADNKEVANAAYSKQ